MKNHPVSRRDFCKAPLVFACALTEPVSGKPLGSHRSADAASGARPQEGAGEETIYAGVALEFVQPWDQLERIKQIKELGLGNFVVLCATFHVGSEAEKRRWKQLYPELAEQIDKLPRAESLKEAGTPAIFPIPDDLIIKEAELCRENNLYFDLAPYIAKCQGERCASLFAKLREVGGKYFLKYSMFGEHTSSLGGGRPASSWKAEQGIDPTKMNLQSMHDWFVARDRQAVQEARKAGVPRIDNLEATAQFRLALEAGVDIPVLEMVPYEPLSGLAAVRGAAKAYRSPLWGVQFAFGWYRRPVDLSVPNRARIAYNLFYAGGARLFNDLNDYFHVYSLAAGWFAEPRPPARMGEKEYRGFDDPICVAGRKVLQDHYKFVQFHSRPAGGPRVKLAFALGHLDAYTGWIGQSHVWAVAEPGWEAGDAEKTWQYFHHYLYVAEPWYTPPLKDYWQNDPLQTIQYGTPPCGQVDIVPVEAPLDVLQSYSCLVFLGWNTMTEDLYEKLKRYVQGGGRLFMSLPQLSTQVERQVDLQLLRDGDYGDLFGARIVGVGEQAGAIQFVQAGAYTSYQFPQGARYEEGMRLAKAEIGTARVLAASAEGAPVLLENREGKGHAYLLTSWGYPGQHLQRFMTDLLRTIGNGEQDEIRVEGEALFYAVYGPGGEAAEKLTTIYLVNRSFYGLPAYGRVAIQGKTVLVEVKGYDMRIVWKRGDLVVSPFDRFVKVETVEAPPGSYRVSLVAEPGVHRIQIACLGKEIDRVLLDGRSQVLARGVEKITSFESSLGGKHQLTVQVR